MTPTPPSSTALAASPAAVAPRVCVVILTKNEHLHLARALASVKSFAAEVFVIDSYSTDDTVEIARSLGATVLQNPFVHQAQQFQWALENAPITADWILRLDADEIIEPDLAAEIAERLPRLPREVAGVNFKRKHIFMDRWVRHGGRYPLVMLRLWRRGQGRVENRWMDEHVIVWGGSTVTFEGGFADHNLNDIAWFVQKHNQYATREAIDVLSKRHGLGAADTHALTAQGSSRQAALKRFIKERVYNRIPFTAAAPAYFLWRYLFQLGFLDGRSGLVYHFLQGFWYRFLVGARVMELERGLAHLSDRHAIAAELSRLTGQRVSAEGGTGSPPA